MFSFTLPTHTIYVQLYLHKPFMFSLTDTNHSCSTLATQHFHVQSYLHKPFMHVQLYLHNQFQVCSTLPTQAFHACLNYPFMYVQPTEIIQACSTWQTLTHHVPAWTPAHGTGPTQTRLPVWCTHHISTGSSNSKSRKCNNAEHGSAHKAMCKPFLFVRDTHLSTQTSFSYWLLLIFEVSKGNWQDAYIVNVKTDDTIHNHVVRLTRGTYVDFAWWVWQLGSQVSFHCAQFFQLVLHP